jgi:hypothetical protein
MGKVRPAGKPRCRGRILLKWIFKITVEGLGIGFVWFKVGTNVLLLHKRQGK